MYNTYALRRIVVSGLQRLFCGGHVQTHMQTLRASQIRVERTLDQREREPSLPPLTSCLKPVRRPPRHFLPRNADLETRQMDAHLMNTLETTLSSSANAPFERQIGSGQPDTNRFLRSTGAARQTIVQQRRRAVYRNLARICKAHHVCGALEAMHDRLKSNERGWAVKTLNDDADTHNRQKHVPMQTRISPISYS
jgi:hypothetical protein